ncbi:MAG: sulfate adenylyltransferase [Candidatus Dormibacteraeota bacterium]|nr:sulfate adenylyltransferase [Candidatus Dormibacteraeota bacterium]MBO0744759.1 sulfate adenylyltransferase [Candidatus Dormibacteraeota bacterium]
MSKGFVIWFTGLSGAGKSTLAERLRSELTLRGRGVEVLDGDDVRTHLSRGLGFSKDDRDTNVRRIGYVARLLARNGTVAITAAISPYRAVRDEIRLQTRDFVEVYVRCSIEELVRRDVKGLYERALRGEIDHFTGVSDPYEAPLNAEVVVDSETQTPEESVALILAELERRGLLGRAAAASWLEGEEADAAADGARRLPRLEVGQRELADAFMLGTGALSPLQGFTGEADYRSVLERGRLAGGWPYTIPITLRLDDLQLRALGAADRVALSVEGEPVATVEVEGAFSAPHREEALAVYQTDDPAHPGVRALRQRGTWSLAGRVVAFRRPASPFPQYELLPSEVRERKAALGWRTMVGFQTRNPVHRAHEYLQKVALEFVDGLLLHPLVGETKADDIPAETRMRAYEELLRNYYPADRVLLATNPAWMRYAGPKEAVFHAIVRRNFGCTHFIVGRDHAGVGDYYDTYAAHRIFDQYQPGELGIEILRFEHTFYCRACGQMASPRTCPHGPEDRASLSGSRVRQLLAAGQTLPPEFSRPEVAAVLLAAQEETQEAAS